MKIATSPWVPRAQTDQAKRKQLYADMQVLMHEHCGVGIPLFKSTVDAYNTKLKRYGTSLLGGFIGSAFAEHERMMDSISVRFILNRFEIDV